LVGQRGFDEEQISLKGDQRSGALQNRSLQGLAADLSKIEMEYLFLNRFFRIGTGIVEGPADDAEVDERMARALQPVAGHDEGLSRGNPRVLASDRGVIAVSVESCDELTVADQDRHRPVGSIRRGNLQASPP
jgi:hypothetical protein